VKGARLHATTLMTESYACVILSYESNCTCDSVMTTMMITKLAACKIVELSDRLTLFFSRLKENNYASMVVIRRMF